MNKSYKRTLAGCYLGYVIQAVAINIVTVLYVTLRGMYGMTYTQFGALVLMTFLIQLTGDIVLSRLVERTGFRPFAIACPVLAFAGLGLFAITPALLPGNEYVGFVAGTLLFSVAAGMIEVIISPMVDAIPAESKGGAMTLLHSFYSWGHLLVVLLTALAIWTLGGGVWQWIMLFWMLLPVVCFIVFVGAPMPPINKSAENGGRRSGRARLLGSGAFWLMLAAMVLGSASELVIAQWISPFMERGLGLSKLVGDTAGVCVFALCMALVRTLYGRFESRFDIGKVMIAGCAVAAVCYAAAALSPSAALSAAACGLCGLGVSLLWPGTLVAASERFPQGGMFMFAILAAAGDLGGSVGPYVSGLVADAVPLVSGAAALAARLGITPEQLGLKAALLLGTAAPLLTLVCQIAIRRGRKQNVPKGAETDAA